MAMSEDQAADLIIMGKAYYIRRPAESCGWRRQSPDGYAYFPVTDLSEIAVLETAAMTLGRNCGTKDRPIV